MAIPDYQTLMLPVLKCAAAQAVRVPEIDTQIADQFGLTAEERTKLLPSGRQRILHNRLHWAKFYLSKAGLTEPAPGRRFIASDSGRELLNRNLDKIDNELLLNYRGFADFYHGTTSRTDENDASQDADVTSTELSSSKTPEEQIEAAHAAIHTALKAELLQRIMANTPSFFEQIIIELLLRMGYGGSHKDTAEQLGRSGDGGIDGVINEDRLGLDRVYIQAKRWENVVGRPEVQAFVGSLVGLGAHKGVFVTTSKFSQQAFEFARHLVQRVVLIDGEHLAELMIEHDIGVRLNRAIQFKRIDEDFFSEEDS